MVLKLGHFGKYIIKILKGIEMWLWRMMQKISVRNEVVVHRVKENINILHTIKKGRLTELVASCVLIAFQNALVDEKQRENRSDGKTRRKAQAAIGWPQGKEEILEIERGRTRPHSVKKSLLKRLRICRNTSCGMTGNVTVFKLHTGWTGLNGIALQVHSQRHDWKHPAFLPVSQNKFLSEHKFTNVTNDLHNSSVLVMLSIDVDYCRILYNENQSDFNIIKWQVKFNPVA